MTKCRICKKEFSGAKSQQTICPECIAKAERIMRRNWDVGNDKERAHWRCPRTTCIICNKPLDSGQRTTCAQHSLEWGALRREVYRKWGKPLHPSRHKHRNPQREKGIVTIHDYCNNNLAVDAMNAKLSGMSYGEYMSKKGGDKR